MKTAWCLQWPTTPCFFWTRNRDARKSKSLNRLKTQHPNTRYREKTPENKKHENPKVDSSKNPHAKKHGARLLKKITKKNPKSTKHQIWKKLCLHRPSATKLLEIPVSWKLADVSSDQQLRSFSDQTSARAHTQKSESTENQKPRRRISQKDPRAQEKHKNPRVDSSKNFPHAKYHRARLLKTIIKKTQESNHQIWKTSQVGGQFPKRQPVRIKKGSISPFQNMQKHPITLEKTIITGISRNVSNERRVHCSTRGLGGMRKTNKALRRKQAPFARP